MAFLSELEAPNSNIRDLTGLELATSLTSLNLGTEFVSRVGYVNSNHISDFSPLSGLTSLRSLSLSSNNISDLSPLVANTGLGSGDVVRAQNNPLSATSINTHIPALQDRGVDVSFGALKPAVEKSEQDILDEMIESLGIEEWEN